MYSWIIENFDDTDREFDTLFPSDNEIVNNPTQNRCYKNHDEDS